MLARRRLVAAAVLATAALSPVALAQAVKIPTVDVWMGKTHRKGDMMQIVNVRGQKAVSLALTVECVSNTGPGTPVSVSATGKLSGGRVSVTNKRAGAEGTAGTATFRATLPRTRAATGTVTWNLPATNNQQACAGRDTFKLKHSISHGG
jgi:hypothetical protein